MGCFWNKILFAYRYFPHLLSEDFGRHHIEMLSRVRPQDRGILVADAAPRGGGKTTIRTIEIIHDIIYKGYYETLGLIPNDFIVIVGETDDAVYERMDDIQAELEQNRALQNDFGNLIGQTWGHKRMITKNDVCIVAKSRGARIRGLLYRGRRPRKVLLTDVQKPKHVDSPDQRAKDMEWFTSDVRRTGDNQGIMNTIVEGTILHEDALLAQLRRNPAYIGGTYPAIHKWSNRPDLWDEWKQKYIDLTDPHRKETALLFYEENKTQMLSGVEMLWPEGLSYYRCQEMIVEDGFYSFQKEMQQNPEDEEKQLFNMKDASYFRIEREGLFREDMRIVKWEDLMGISIFLDWAGGKDSKQNCFAAIVVIAWESFPHTNAQYKYVIDAWLERKPPSAQIAKCFDFIEKYQLIGRTRLGIESANLNAQIDADLHTAFENEKEKRKEEGKPIIVSPEAVYQSTEKYTRISKLEPKIANGWVCFSRTLPQEFMDQMRLFPTHQFLDGPDALEGAIRLPINQKPKQRRKTNEIGIPKITL